MYIYIFIYSFIYTILYIQYVYVPPTPVGLSSLANEVIALPLAYMQGSSYELSPRLSGRM